MNKFIKRVFNGFIIGIANILPGVSGSALAMSLGFYEDLIDSVANFFKDIKKNLIFLIPFGIGVVLAILLFSKIIMFFMGKFALPTIALFIGLMLGGIPSIYKNIKNDKKKPINYIIFIIIFISIITLAIISSNGSPVILESLNLIDYIKLIIVGATAAATMIFPGISGTAVLMMIGYYQPLLSVISKLTDFGSLTFSKLIEYGLILAPLAVGLVLGGFILSKLVEYLLKNFKTQTYFAILAFITSSVIVIFIGKEGSAKDLIFTIPQTLIAIALLITGTLTGLKLSSKSK